MLELSRAARMAAVCLILLIATVAGAGPAQADGPPAGASCSAPAGPLYAHPGRERIVYLPCTSSVSVTFDQPAHGTLSQGTSLTYFYTPDASYLGPDHFTLHPTGASGAEAPIVVDLTVTDTENTAPQCGAAAALTVRDGETRSVRLPPCEDPEGDPVDFAAITPPAHGSLGAPVVTHGLDTTATIAYTPTPGSSGTDTFTYRATDDKGAASDPRTATITVHTAGYNDAPSCPAPPPGLPPGFFPPAHGTTDLSPGCSDADGDPWTLAIVTPTTHGTLAVDGTVLRYTPDPGYSGSDAYAFTASDDHGGTTAVQNRTLDVVPNGTPVCASTGVAADGRDAAADPGTTVALPCTDADHDQLFGTVIAAPAHGQLTFDDVVQTLTYTPDLGFGGTDTATFSVADAHGGVSATQTLTFTVDDGDDPGDDPGTGDGPPDQGDSGDGDSGDGQPGASTSAGPAADAASAPPGPDHGAGTTTHLPPPATAAQRAKALLGGRTATFGLGFTAADAQAFVATHPRPTGALAAVFCPHGCTVQVGARLLVRTGRSGTAHASATLTLTPRTLKVTAAHPGTVALHLTKAQRHTLAKARRASVVLTLKTKVGTKTHTAHRTLALTL